jgi:hypothetical protein
MTLMIWIQHNFKDVYHLNYIINNFTRLYEKGKNMI